MDSVGSVFLVLQPLKLGGGEITHVAIIYFSKEFVNIHLRTNGLFATGGFLYSRQVRRKAIKKLSLSKSPKERGRSGFFT